MFASAPENYCYLFAIHLEDMFIFVFVVLCASITESFTVGLVNFVVCVAVEVVLVVWHLGMYEPI